MLRSRNLNSALKYEINLKQGYTEEKNEETKMRNVLTGVSFTTQDVHPGNTSSSGSDHTKELPKMSSCIQSKHLSALYP